MREYGMRYDCGCCHAQLRFESDERAEAALHAAGLRNGATIVDDAGETHRGLDTFYGMWFEMDVEEKP